MWCGIACLLVLVVVTTGVSIAREEDLPSLIVNVTEEAAIEYLQKVDEQQSRISRESVVASWNYESNLTEHNLQIQLETSAKGAAFARKIWEETKSFPWKTYQSPMLRRQFEKHSFLGSAALSPEKNEQLDKTISVMQAIYSKAKVCDYHKKDKCDLSLEPEITKTLANSRDPEELKHLWVSWRNASGTQVRTLFETYVQLCNEAALKNNYTNAALMWIRDYEAEDFPDQVEALWQQVQPLYQQLHAYIRRKLRQQYGETIVPKTGPIPAHLFGNMWSQTWENIGDFSRPFPNKPALNITPALTEQGYTPVKIFKLAEEFFTSLNLSAMPETFWNNSILEKPKDREIVCHASAWDFYDAKDFRVKQCTEITQQHLETAHHEMGHVQYFLQYKHQPTSLRDGANPGFHEAVGDVMSLSVGTPTHLHKLKLLPEIPNDYEADINQLFQVALHKVAFLPFGYLIDQYRWSIFKGDTTQETYNCEWWKLVEKYQGMVPPLPRTEKEFDAGSKYHVVGGVPYIRYFVSFIVQFQFHEALCTVAGQYDPAQPDLKPLHKCDIHGSTEAGNLLGKMLQLGGSEPWPDAMEVLTQQRKMNATSLLNYFRPLQKWLEEENKRTGEPIGWENSQKECASKTQ